MKKNKFIALLCSAAMAVSAFSGFVTATAAPNDVAVMDETTIEKGYKLEYDETKSTAAEKYIDVYYVGYESVKTATVSIDLPTGVAEKISNAEVDTKFSGSVSVVPMETLHADNVLICTMAGSAQQTLENNLLFTFKLTLSEDFTEEWVATLNADSSIEDVNGEQYYGDNFACVPTTVKPDPSSIPTASPIPTAGPITKGYKLVADEVKSTATEKYIDVYYVGYESVKTATVSMDLPADVAAKITNAEVDTKFSGSVSVVPMETLHADNVLICTMAGSAQQTLENNLLFTFKLTLSEDFAEPWIATLNADASIEDVNGEQYYGDDFQCEYTIVKPAAPVATDAPSTDAPSTDAPSTDAPSTDAPSVTTAPTAMPRPTYHPIATATPEVSDEATATPEVSVEPTASPISTAEPITKGYKLVADEVKSTATEKYIDVYYVGYESVKTATVSIDLPADVAAKITNAEVDTKFSGSVSVVPMETLHADNVLICTMAGSAQQTLENNLLFTFKLTLSEDFAEPWIAALNVDASIEDVNGEQYYGDDFQCEYAIVKPAAPVATEAPATEAPATEAPATPVPVVTTVPMTDVVDVTKVAEVEKNNEGVPTIENPSKAFIILDTKAVYGKDYVAVIGDKELTKEEFENKIWGYDGAVEDAVKDIKLNILTEDTLKLVSALNDAANNVLVEEKTVEVNKKATEKPTPGPDKNGVEFQGWSTNAISVSKNSTKQAVATFENIPEDAKNIEIEFYVDDTDLVKITSGSTTTTRNLAKATVKATAKKAKKDSTTVSAELTYTLNGEKFTVLSTKDLTVKTTSSTSGGSGGSGAGGTTGGIIAGPNTGTGIVIPPVTGSVNFQDLAQAPWAEDAITFLAERGIVNGRSATAFEPMGEITRAEFAKLVVTIYGINVGEGLQSTVYPDVVSGEWYTPYVAAAAQYGIVTGYPDGMFRPNALVSRQEMAVMMYRAITTFRTPLPTINQPKAWSDEIPAWSADAINALQVAGVMNGVSDTEFGATDASTRAMAAQMIYNLYSVVE